MSLIVQKYGGMSLVNATMIKKAAGHTASVYHKKNSVMGVTSALGETTDELVDLAYQISTRPNQREMDVLLATGEQASAALFAIALWKIGIPAISFIAGQIGFETTEEHGDARIKTITNREIIKRSSSRKKGCSLCWLSRNN